MKSNKQSAVNLRQQRGMTLIESVVAIVVAALGILGVVGTQVRTLADTQTTVRRAQAIRLIEDLSERMRVNPSALAAIDTYVTAFPDAPIVAACPSVGCNKNEQATYDLAVWKQNVRSTLPLGKAAVFVPQAETGLVADQRRQLGVMIAWRENERDSSSAYKDQIDATKERAADGSLSDGAGGVVSCPVNHTCHLQYLPVPTRCAAYQPLNGHVCPGE